MSPITKYEAIGIFLSVAVMAVALGMIRFETDRGEQSNITEVKSDAAVIVASDNSTERGGGLETALKQAATPKGELVNLVIDDVRIGTGTGVKVGDTVSVNYIGTTRDGVQFDNSYINGKPFEFTVGEGKVIQGWDKGLVGMKVGGERILVIPPSLAYGDRQVGPIPPGSPLVFAIELLEIK